MLFNNTELWAATDPSSQATINQDFTQNGQDIKSSGAFGGAFAGFNKQINYGVFSMEGELNGAGIHKEFDTNLPGAACALAGNLLGNFFVALATSQCGGATSTTVEEKMVFYSTFRGRVGYDLSGFLPYVAAGLSIAVRVSVNGTYSAPIAAFSCSTFVNSINRWDLGWNAGAPAMQPPNQIAAVVSTLLRDENIRGRRDIWPAF